MNLRIENDKYEIWDKDKLIASSHNTDLPSIDFSQLSEEDCKNIGWVDVEKLANEYFIKHNLLNKYDDNYTTKQKTLRDFIEGFKAAQDINEKKYSEDDLRKAIRMARFNEDVGDSTQYCNSDDEIIQSLSQPKMWEIDAHLSEDGKSYIVTKVK